MGKKYFGYVSMPFGEKNGFDFDAFFTNKIFSAGSLTPKSNIIIFREDTSLEAPWKKSQLHLERVRRQKGIATHHETQLRQAIQDNIIAADFIIAVLTTLNPNVMLEVGYAQALNKVIIYLVAEDEFRGLPGNLHNLKRLHVYVVGEDLRFNLNLRIQEALSTIKDLKEQEGEGGHGISTYFHSRQSIHLWREFEKAQNRIWIITTNLTTVNANFIDAIVEALHKNPELEVKILTSDPDNDFIGPRANQLGEDETGYRKELEGSLQSIHAKLKKYKNCTIKTYKDFPVQIWHLVDDYLYIGQSSLLRRSRHNCVFGIQTNIKGVMDTYLRHFEVLWENSTPTIVKYG